MNGVGICWQRSQVCAVAGETSTRPSSSRACVARGRRRRMHGDRSVEVDGKSTAWSERGVNHLLLVLLLCACVRALLVVDVRPCCVRAGLKRTGKSCRLRWVNYLHPGLRRGRITADEERVILELHAQWGSRWSRIARCLPGRTDNEIKNFWRTRTRKKALEHRRNTSNGNTATASSLSSSSSAISSGSPPNRGWSSSPLVTESPPQGRSGRDDEAELEEASTTTVASQPQHQQQQLEQKHCYTMDDQLWNEMEAASAGYVADSCGGAGHDHGGAVVAVETPPSMPSPVWEFCSDYCSLWRIDDEEYYKMRLDS